jgi:uncharacterized membrane protein (UPF0127 family)
LQIKNITRNSILSNNCSVARTFFARFRGLQLKKSLPRGHGLLITPCNSIHMFFMRFSIDAVFIDSNNKVIYIEECIRPWRVSKIVRKAKSVLELPAGTVSDTDTRMEDQLEIENLI